MAVTYLKQASKTPLFESANARQVVAAMLAEIDREGEAAVKDQLARTREKSPSRSLAKSKHRARARQTGKRQIVAP